MRWLISPHMHSVGDGYKLWLIINYLVPQSSHLIFWFIIEEESIIIYYCYYNKYTTNNRAVVLNLFRTTEYLTFYKVFAKHSRKYNSNYIHFFKYFFLLILRFWWNTYSKSTEHRLRTTAIEGYTIINLSDEMHTFNVISTILKKSIRN
jgi:hypothetical protein